MTSRSKFIDDLNASPNGYIKDMDVDVPATTVSATSSTAFMAIMLEGIWWPASLYESKKNEKVPAKKVFMYTGKAGILMDDYIVGAVKLESRVADTAEKNTILASSSSDYGTGSVDANYNALKTKVSAVKRVQDKESGE
jgi:hypothetical protein